MFLRRRSVEGAAQLSASVDLCDRCIGRRLIGAQGAEQQRQAATKHRGAAAEVAEADCQVCEGRWSDESKWLELLVEGTKGHEFATFQLGTIFPTECEAVEKVAKKAEWADPAIGDNVRTEANRLLAPQLAAATGAEWVNDARPDVQIHLDTRFWTVEVIPTSLYVFGRYTKHSREVPQTHWPCKTCQGRGCWQCDDSGVQYESSVEQVIGDIVLPAFGGSHYSFHGAGREDIDALMLGTGRPFVLEIHNPRRRTLPEGHLEALVQAVQAAKPDTGVGLLGLEMSDKDTVVRIKDGAYNKEYLAHCISEAEVSREQVEAAAAQMTGAMLQQRTPERVSHRRADLVRERRVHHMVLEDMPDAKHFSVRVLADSGAYIKEMVSGDGGRTTPCLADALGVTTKVEFLDVVAILDDA